MIADFPAPVQDFETEIPDSHQIFEHEQARLSSLETKSEELDKIKFDKSDITDPSQNLTFGKPPPIQNIIPDEIE